MARFGFAWVGPTDTTWDAAYDRMDEHIFSVDVTEEEGGFGLLAIVIENLSGTPRGGLLAQPNLWAWLSRDGAPVLFGRMVGSPEDLAGETIRIHIRARPRNFEALKAAFAETLKEAPFYDRVWIAAEYEDDPDTVLEARPQLLHVDRITHALSISHIAVGEDGIVDIPATEGGYESLSINYESVPLKRVRVKARVAWDQRADGEMDITQELLAAFRAAGSPPYYASSYTGQGFQTASPRESMSLKGGWSIGTYDLRRADGVWRPQRFTDVTITGAGDGSAESATEESYQARFYIWEWVPTMTLTYEVSRQKIEDIVFSVAADVQHIMSEIDDDEFEIITRQTTRVQELIDPATTADPDGTMPIRVPWAASYINTTRGRQSFEYLVMLARSTLLKRARAVTVSVRTTFDFGLQFSLRKSATIHDPRLPDGSATGKIIAYHLHSGKDGEWAEVTIGCLIGTGGSLAEAAGTGVYAEPGYMAPGYQVMSGAASYPGGVEEITYSGLSEVVINDDGINFGDMRPADLIESFEVHNGETVQRGVLSQKYPDIPAAVEALNAKFTEAELALKPLTGGPFVTLFQPTVSRLQIPKQIDLEAIV